MKTRREVLSGMAKAAPAMVAAGVVLAATGSTKAAEKHPKIHQAMDALRDARAELKDAAHDFGGHRVKAIKLIDDTLEELKEALKFAK